MRDGLCPPRYKYPGALPARRRASSDGPHMHMAVLATDETISNRARITKHVHDSSLGSRPSRTRLNLGRNRAGNAELLRCRPWRCRDKSSSPTRTGQPRAGHHSHMFGAAACEEHTELASIARDLGSMGGIATGLQHTLNSSSRRRQRRDGHRGRSVRAGEARCSMAGLKLSCSDRIGE